MGLFNKNNKKDMIIVEGMKCVHCSAKVENALKKAHVNSEINLESKTVIVSYNEKKITLEEIKRIIEEVGFTCI